MTEDGRKKLYTETSEGYMPTWETCQSLDDLAAMSARWLRGEIPEGIFGSGCVLMETISILPQLAAVNDLGFLTSQSQPASQDTIDPRGWRVRQRAYVHGYTTSYRAELIAAACEQDAQLECHATPVKELSTSPRSAGSGCTHTNERIVDGHPVAGAGWAIDWSTFANMTMNIHDETEADLRDSVYVTVIDLVYGREHHLWETLIRALR